MWQKIVLLAVLTAVASFGQMGVVGGGGSVLGGKPVGNLSLCSGANNFLTLNLATNRIECATPPGATGGEANTASNLGTGAARFFVSKNGVDLQFRRAQAGSGRMTVTESGNFVSFDVVEAALELVATQITSGVLDVARIPNLDAAKIATGAFDAGRIPNLSATKITTDVFDAARIPNLSATKITSDTLPLARGGTNQGTWVAGRCVQVAADGTTLESASAACGSGGGGSGDVVGTTGSGAPSANCTAGKAFYTDTVTGDIYHCSAENTWKLILSSGTGTGILTFVHGALGDAPTVEGTSKLQFDSEDGKLASRANGGSWVKYALTSDIPTRGANVDTFLGTPSSANLAGALTDETGTGPAVFANTPTLDTPIIDSYIVSELPTAGTAGRLAVVTDGTAVGDCTTGGGTSITLCRDTGSVWAAVGDGGSGGGGTIPFVTWLPAAACDGASGVLMWDTLSTNKPTATCSAGSTETTMMRGAADFPDSNGAYSIQQTILLPDDWTGAIDLKFLWRAAATSGDVVWQAATACRADGEVQDVAFNAASVIADTAKGTTLQLNTVTITGLTTTGCAAGELMHLRVVRDREHANDTITGVVSLIGVEIKMRRAI